MTDIVSPKQRHYMMSRIRSQDTRPELKLRHSLFKLGFRYRLYSKRLPGHPDLSLRKYRTVVFVNGCFWHQHPGCKAARIPETNHEYWERKFARNIARDQIQYERLISLGWNVIIVWECQLAGKKFPEELEWVAETIRANRDRIEPEILMR